MFAALLRRNPQISDIKALTSHTAPKTTELVINCSRNTGFLLTHFVMPNKSDGAILKVVWQEKFGFGSLAFLTLFTVGS